MIIIYHQNNVVDAIWNNADQHPINVVNLSIVDTLFTLAKMYPSSIIIWCHISLKKYLCLEEVIAIFHHKKIMASYNPSANFYLPNSIGYIEDSPFIKINKKIQFATWQMSSFVGGISSEVLQASEHVIPKYKKFDFFLVSLAKVMMPLGLLCYSAPSLIKPNSTFQAKDKEIDSLEMFYFVKKHYRARWVFILFLNYMLYERKFKLLPLLNSLFHRQIKVCDSVLDAIIINSSKNLIDIKTVDVIIPTIGRKKYLYDVLCDFRQQTHLPNKIIIVEQNPSAGSESELDYLENEIWPFEILHTFTRQAGACNARNIALNKTDSRWIFLADDDNRFSANLIEDMFEKIRLTGNEVVTTNYIQPHEKLFHKKVIQWPTFGAGNSFVSSNSINKIRFNMAFEFGYGEDADFGMQLRHKGFDILYLPQPEILHLKAPIGGFRTKPQLAWHNDPIQPKPSPTVMLFKIMYNTPQQLLGYKVILFFKFYRHQPIKNPFAYYKKFQQQWNQSVYWANKLI
ncbi:glycosyltransferase family 2 protein [Flavobacterium soli]|uniref:glycosyltransferase family 2 protein n=1 Tax=Flavobacterium soli TaxID=344881 RepID=UPI0003FABA38|nr:glycosyltransferase [Flavobacterium soli]